MEVVHALLEYAVLFARTPGHCVCLTRAGLPIHQHRAVDAVKCTFDQVFEFFKHVSLFGVLAKHPLELEILGFTCSAHGNNTILDERVVSLAACGVEPFVVVHLANAQEKLNERSQVSAGLQEERPFILSHWDCHDGMLGFHLCYWLLFDWLGSGLVLF